jgi:hypothetical protein
MNPNPTTFAAQVLRAYLNERISLGKVADLLQLSRFEVEASFRRLGIRSAEEPARSRTCKRRSPPPADISERIRAKVSRTPLRPLLVPLPPAWKRASPAPPRLSCPPFSSWNSSPASS